MDLKRISWPVGLFSLREVEHHVADVEGRPLAKTSTLPWTTAWPIILVLFPLPTSLFFSFSSHFPHSSFPCPIFFYTLPFPDLISLPTQHHPHPPVLSFILVMSHSLVVSLILHANPSLCLPISLFSAPLRLAHYFCSIVHSVWGWTRTPPWPPVRGERLSGTKTSIAPFFSSLFIPCDRWS